MSQRPQESVGRLATSLEQATVTGDAETVIDDIAYDSRQVRPGSLFVAIRGYQTDGHRFIPQAIAAGARALCVEDRDSIPEDCSLPVICVGDTRPALAQLAAALYDHPSRQLCCVAVTGTNGKTTVSHTTGCALRASGSRTAVIGTLGVMLDDGCRPLSRTTPESADLQCELRRLVDDGYDAVVMEASSHALHLHRMEAVDLNAAVFTNLTQDHLDFHHGLDEYLAAKERLFTTLAAASRGAVTSIVNIDDEAGVHLTAVAQPPVKTYSLERAADWQAEQIQLTPGGASFRLRSAEGAHPVQTRLVGRFNVYNAVAAIAAAASVGAPVEQAVAGVETAPPPPGRMETIDEGQPFSVSVDYAHTPDSLDKVLETVRELTSGRVIVVVGCGGDRDRTKRPQMGAIAARRADLAIFTSDNPRSENPDSILAEIVAGVESGSHEVIADRRAAIEWALSEAREGDFVLVAGKGHETTQTMGERVIPFDDRQVCRESLRGWRQGAGGDAQ